MKIGTGIQAILMFRLKILMGVNFGVTDGTELCSAPSSWAQAA
jgi:hypothetical protein